MKYLIIVMIASLVGLLSGLRTERKKNPCTIYQRYYYHGKLVYEKTSDTLIRDYGCTQYYLVKGKSIVADSTVTTLK